MIPAPGILPVKVCGRPGLSACNEVEHSARLLLTTMKTPEYYNPPAHSDEVLVTVPQEHVLLIVLNRPKALNTMTPTMEKDLSTLLDWFDNEPSLWYVETVIHLTPLFHHTLAGLWC